MLKGIKEMINQKKEFQEAASIIMEDANGSNLDDLIILGEDANIPENDEDHDNDDDDKDEKPESHEEPDGDEDGSKPSDGDGDEPNHTEPDGDEDGSGIKGPDGDGDEDDLLGSSVGGDNENPQPEEDPLPLPGDDLPTPVGRQTGEPIVGDIDDLLNMNIDIKTNTLTDVLPIPPANAGEAIASDDILSQKIDSGFGGDDNDVQNDLSSPIHEEPTPSLDNNEGDDLLSEAISIGDDPAPTTDDGTGNTGSTADDTNPPTDEGDGENSVTSAVRDKVSEADTTDDPGLDDTSVDSNSKKEDLLKKLGNITKNLEDAKKAVMNCI